MEENSKKAIICPTCEYCGISDLQKQGSSIYTDYKCKCVTPTRYAKVSEMEDNVVRPKWCPLCNKEKENTTFQLKYKDMTCYDKIRFWENIPPITTWDDIEVNKVYHVPPFNNTKRMDVVVTYKSSNYLTYKKLNTDTNYAYTLYPSSQMSKFFVPHKLVNAELKDSRNDD